MSAASEQASRNGDVLLPVCRWLGIGLVFTSGGRAGLFGRAGSAGGGQPVVGWRGSWRSAGEKFSQVAGVRDTGSQVVRMAGSEPGGQAFPVAVVCEVGGAKALQDRLDDRCVVEQRVGYRTWLDPRRDDQRRDAYAVAAERLRVVVGGVGRRDVVEEAAVLVVEDDQERFVPLRAGRQGVVDGEDKVLAVSDVGGGVVVVLLEAEGVEVAPVRVDPRDRGRRLPGSLDPRSGP